MSSKARSQLVVWITNFMLNYSNQHIYSAYSFQQEKQHRHLLLVLPLERAVSSLWTSAKNSTRGPPILKLEFLFLLSLRFSQTVHSPLSQRPPLLPIFLKEPLESK